MPYHGTTWKCKKDGLFHERLSYYIAKKDERLDVISKKTGISMGTISNYCLGNYTPSVPKLLLLCGYLGISVSVLMGDNKVVKNNISEDDS